MSIKIPLPPIEIQQKIVEEIQEIETRKNKALNSINQLEIDLRELVTSIEGQEVKIDHILSLEYGKALPENLRKKGSYPVMGSNGITGYHSEYLINSPAIIVGRKGSAGKVVWVNENCYPIDTTFYVKLVDENINLKLVYYILRTLNLQGGGVGVPGLNRNDVYHKTVILPSQLEQQKIVAEIEALEMEIAKAQQVIDNAPLQKKEILRKYL